MRSPLLHNDSRGFSLVEFAVALTIFGIALALAVPNFQASMRRAQFDRASAELESDLRLAITEAKARGRTLRMTFGGGGYSFTDAADSTALFARDFEEHVSLAATGNPLIFPWGMVQPADVQITGPHKNLTYRILPTGKVEEDQQQ